MSIYYRAGKDRKGKRVTASELVSRDHFRDEFLAKAEADPAWVKEHLGIDADKIPEFLAAYRDRPRAGGDFVESVDTDTCECLYELGTPQGEVENDKQKVLCLDGKIREFAVEDTDQWDRSHETAVPDDITKINSFGAAALLNALRRRFVSNLNIYTYVGDIVICLNPYMRLPKMVDIAEPPNVKEYVSGQDPHSYATAHFAYWGLTAPERYAQEYRNQSCIVSGESGAGKTVACSIIMKYLAKLSVWRAEKIGETKWKTDVNVTQMVGGVSPFLEAFGNAKTLMNDNSSRFGKFVKIKFDDGRIIGAEMEHYLLEKARLVNQGKGSRNFHIFYFLCKGATDEEREKLGIRDATQYDMLMHGDTAIIAHEGPEYDNWRMNNPYNADPDETGVRAAFAAAQVSPEVQFTIWSVLAGLLKLGNVKFKKTKAGSEVASGEIEAAEQLLGFEPGSLGPRLCIIRRIIAKKIIDTPLPPAKSCDNRDALIKEIYGKLFDEVIRTANRALNKAASEGDGFVGLLDIFGFEVFQKNSLEQLCINFANEKLQKLFNNYVFEEERAVYQSEGLDDSVIPSYRNNTPCCNLIEKKSANFVGILPLLDDQSASDKNTDEKFCAKLIASFGRDPGPYAKAPTDALRKASQYFYARKGAGTKYFHIVHFAGEVKYMVGGFLEKNKDKLPGQLIELCDTSTAPMMQTIFQNGKDSGGSSRSSSRGGKPALKTIAGKFKKQLSSLAHTLSITSPHYVRCIKPNDLHMRPIDGMLAFDAWKTYRQLLYAGVMEVCRIKKEGYPFRETYEKFWFERCVGNGYHKYLGMDPNMNPRDAAIEVCQRILPQPVLDEESGKMKPSWATGNSRLFAKDSTPMILLQWYQKQVSGKIRGAYRFHGWALRTARCIQAIKYVGRLWQEKYFKIKFARIAGTIIAAQAMAQSILARQVFNRRRAILEKQRFLEGVVKRLQLSWRLSTARKNWRQLFIRYQDYTILRQLERTTDWRRICDLVVNLQDRDVVFDLSVRHIQAMARCVLAKQALEARRVSLATSNRLIYALQLNVKLKIIMRRYVRGHGERKRKRNAQLLYRHLFFLPHRRSIFTYLAHAVETLQYQFLHSRNFAPGTGLLATWTSEAEQLCASGNVIGLEKHLDFRVRSGAPRNRYARLGIFPNLINHCDQRTQNTLLYHASANGNLLCVRVLLASKATIDAGTKFQNLTARPGHKSSASSATLATAKETPLMAAARGGDRNIELVKALLQCGPEMTREDDPDVKFCESAIPPKALTKFLAARNAEGETVMDGIINDSGPHNEQLMLLLFNLGSRCSTADANEMLQMEVESYYSRIRIKRRRLRRLVDPEESPLSTLDASAAASDVVRMAIGATDTAAAAITDGISGATVAYHAEDSDDDVDDFLSSPARGAPLDVDDLFAQYEKDHPELMLLENEHESETGDGAEQSSSTYDTKQSEASRMQEDREAQEARVAAAVAATTPEAVEAHVEKEFATKKAQLQAALMDQGVRAQDAAVQAVREVARQQREKVRAVLEAEYAQAGAGPEQSALLAVQAAEDQQQQQVVQILAAQLADNLDSAADLETAHLSAVRALVAQQEVAIQAEQQEALASKFRSQGASADEARQRATHEVQQLAAQQRQVEARLAAKFEAEEHLSPIEASIKAVTEIATQQAQTQRYVRAEALQAKGVPAHEAYVQAAKEIANQHAQQRQAALAGAFRAQGLSANEASERAVEEIADVQQRQYVVVAALPQAQEEAAAEAAAAHPDVASVALGRTSDAEEKRANVPVRPSEEFLSRFHQLHSVEPVKMRHAAGISHIYPQDSDFARDQAVLNESRAGATSETLWLQTMSKALRISHHSVVRKKMDRYKLSFHAAQRAMEEQREAERRAKLEAMNATAGPTRLARDPLDREALHRLLLRATLGYQAARTSANARGWYFPNASTGEQQGPYPNEKMRAWFRGGHLAMAQPLRFGPGTEECPKLPYVPLSSLWPTPPGLARGSRQQQDLLDGTAATAATNRSPPGALAEDSAASGDEPVGDRSGPTRYNLDAVAAARDAEEACAFPDVGLENCGLGKQGNPNKAKLEDLADLLRAQLKKDAKVSLTNGRGLFQHAMKTPVK